MVDHVVNRVWPSQPNEVGRERARVRVARLEAGLAEARRSEKLENVIFSESKFPVIKLKLK
jgi:hypothetical protein